jgi:hypothetical protein
MEKIYHFEDIYFISKNSKISQEDFDSVMSALPKYLPIFQPIPNNQSFNFELKDNYIHISSKTSWGIDSKYKSGVIAIFQEVLEDLGCDARCLMLHRIGSKENWEWLENQINDCNK